MESTLLTNKQIEFVYERLIVDVKVTELALEKERSKVKEIKERMNSSNPIIRDLLNSVLSELVNSLTSRIEDFESGKSEEGSKYHMAKSVLDSLSVAYYAITGRTGEEFAKSLPEDVIKSVMSKIMG